MPKGVGKVACASRVIKRSVFNRYFIKSATVINFMLCFCANLNKSSLLAIVPSSFTISHITAQGSSPASLAKSTDASVCPVRESTPPFLAISGKTCPGRRKSFGFVFLFNITSIVFALS